MSVEKWWNTNKDSSSWSGAIMGLYWDELWDDARAEILVIYTTTTKDV